MKVLKYIFWIVFIFAVAITIISIIYACIVDPIGVISVDRVTFKRSLAYFYFEDRANTNNFGGVTSYDHFYCYGRVEPDGSVEPCKDNIDVYGYCAEHTLNISETDYILYTAEILTYENGNTKSYIIDYDFYLTPETFSSISVSQ